MQTHSSAKCIGQSNCSSGGTVQCTFPIPAECGSLDTWVWLQSKSRSVQPRYTIISYHHIFVYLEVVIKRNSYKTSITRGKVLSWEYRSPQKRNSRPPASVILCWVSWVENVLLIYYASSDLLVCLHWKLVCLHWKKSLVYGVFGQ